MTSEPIRVLLIDDHAVVRRGLRAFLTTYEEIEVVGEAESGAEGIELARQLLPHVVLMDLVMEGIDGIEATRQIRTISPTTQVIVLTSYSEDERIFPAIKAGALSYLLKDIGPDDLVRAIKAARQLEATLHPTVASRMIQELSGSRTSPLDELTERERHVLACIARGLNNFDIAQELSISERTVKTHVSNILSKLHLQDRTQAALLALREKLVPLEQR
jgi:Response regulator containing a CheY-like receiver domain and an HTH DNA-binding domain